MDQPQGSSNGHREDLKAFFDDLIAKQDGVRAEDVGVEYVRERRKEPWYKRIRFDIGGDYGGYEVHGLKFYTEEEFEEMERRVDAQFAAL